LSLRESGSGATQQINLLSDISLPIISWEINLSHRLTCKRSQLVKKENDNARKALHTFNVLETMEHVDS
jgi:hypothetical protein